MFIFIIMIKEVKLILLVVFIYLLMINLKIFKYVEKVLKNQDRIVVRLGKAFTVIGILYLINKYTGCLKMIERMTNSEQTEEELERELVESVNDGNYQRSAEILVDILQNHQNKAINERFYPDHENHCLNMINNPNLNTDLNVFKNMLECILLRLQGCVDRTGEVNNESLPCIVQTIEDNFHLIDESERSNVTELLEQYSLSQNASQHSNVITQITNMINDIPENIRPSEENNIKQQLLNKININRENLFANYLTELENRKMNQWYENNRHRNSNSRSNSNSNNR
jgi:hypothetical protein